MYIVLYRHVVHEILRDFDPEEAPSCPAVQYAPDAVQVVQDEDQIAQIHEGETRDVAFGPTTPFSVLTTVFGPMTQLLAREAPNL